jgi:hypothetical protein
MNNFEDHMEFIDDNHTTFTKLDDGSDYDYKFSYYDVVSDSIISDYCDKQQLLDWCVVVTKVIK